MSYKFKGTPGPWNYGAFTQYKDGQVHQYYIQSDRLPVLAGTLNWPDEAEANARAIAAVPELIDALSRMTEAYTDLVNCGDCGNWNPEHDEEVVEARAALTKATGRQL